MMSWIERLAEQRIQEAIERGDLEDLPGKGKPLAIRRGPGGLDQRLYFQVLKNNGVVPREVEIIRASAELRAELSETDDPARRKALQTRLAALQTELDVRLGRAGARPGAATRLAKTAELRRRKRERAG